MPRPRRAATRHRHALRRRRRRRRARGASRNSDERSERQDADVEVELTDVVDEPAQDARDGVVAARRDLVRAEHAARRAAVHGPPRRARGRRRRRRSRTAAELRSARAAEEERRRRIAGTIAIACARVRYASDATTRAARAAAASVGRSSVMHERERAGEEERIERLLGHQRAGVDHRRHGEREHGDEQRGGGATTRRARKYAGIAASDISTESIAFAAAYASGTAREQRGTPARSAPDRRTPYAARRVAANQEVPGAASPSRARSR